MGTAELGEKVVRIAIIVVDRSAADATCVIGCLLLVV
jgi:hypothetical protein